MEALYDQHGQVRAWVYTDDLENHRIYDLRGRAIAFIVDNSVYDWQGSHVAWWQDGHVRDRHGAAAYFTADAEHLGVARPARAAKPASPARNATPARPARHPKPARPAKRTQWSNDLPF